MCLAVYYDYSFTSLELTLHFVLFSIMQPTAELGDYDPKIHTPAFVSEFRFVPEQTEEMEIRIIEEYKKMRWLDILFLT